MVETPRSRIGWKRYLPGIIAGIVVFVAAPEIARWLHGGALAQVTPPPVMPPAVTGDCNVFGNNNNMNCPHNYYAPQPRVIADSTASAIAMAARAAGSHNFAVWITGNDPDINPYSTRLISSLNSGGWTGNFAGSTMMSFPPPQDQGLHLCGKTATPPTAATALLRILVSSHVDVSRTYGTCEQFGAEFAGGPFHYDDEMVGIIIGRNGPSNP
jgi:hypothetical protein